MTLNCYGIQLSDISKVHPYANLIELSIILFSIITCFYSNNANSTHNALSIELGCCFYARAEITKAADAAVLAAAAKVCLNVFKDTGDLQPTSKIWINAQGAYPSGFLDLEVIVLEAVKGEFEFTNNSSTLLRKGATIACKKLIYLRCCQFNHSTS